MKSLKIAVLSFGLLWSFSSSAQNDAKTNLDNQVNIVFGVGQLLSNGFNIEGNLFYGRFAFDYSHGVSLDMPNGFLEDGPDKDQGLMIHLPWTTGFGVGFRFTDWLNLRVEPKWHKFELYYDGEAQTPNTLIGDYTTFTLGLGLYANLRPFKNKDNFLKGIVIAPNFRWWPNVSTTLEEDTLTYNNRITEQTETHKARAIGLGNTPFFANVSIGYSWTF